MHIYFLFNWCFLLCLQRNFANTTLKLSRHHIPMLVVFYNWWTPKVISYLSAYHRAILDFTEAGANLRYGLVEASEENLDSK